MTADIKWTIADLQERPHRVCGFLTDTPARRLSAMQAVYKHFFSAKENWAQICDREDDFSYYIEALKALGLTTSDGFLRVVENLEARHLLFAALYPYVRTVRAACQSIESVEFGGRSRVARRGKIFPFFTVATENGVLASFLTGEVSRLNEAGRIPRRGVRRSPEEARHTRQAERQEDERRVAAWDNGRKLRGRRK